MSDINRHDFLDGMKIIGDAIKSKTKREVTIPLTEYEEYKRKAIKYEEVLEVIYYETKTILQNKVENTDREYLYNQIYNIYERICKAN